MRTIVALCLFGLVAVTLAQPNHYTDRFDNINLDEILSNRRFLVPYLQCALEKGRCTPEGRELRSHIKDALENECAKCTEAQRRGARRVIAHLINHEHTYWRELTQKYDGSGKYTHKYEKELRTVSA